MNLARVCGTVVATHKYAGMKGYKLLIIQPVDSSGKDRGNPIIATDMAGAGTDELVFYVTSAEASIAMPEPFVPTDASVLGIVDSVQMNREENQ